MARPRGITRENLTLNGFHFSRLPPPICCSVFDLVVEGDVVLGRPIGERIQAGEDPFAGVRGHLDGVPWKFVNLECVLSEKGQRRPENRIASVLPQATGVLTSAGINAVGLANNHADDFGSDALIDSIAPEGKQYRGLRCGRNTGADLCAPFFHYT